MAVTTDIRFKRVQAKYQTLENAQDEVFDKVDNLESALLGLSESVAANHDLIMENRAMLMAIIKHLEVPYDKPPIGFRQD